MKKMKKVLAFALALIMATGCLSVVANALPSNGIIPTIFIPGLFQCETKAYDENGQVMTDSLGNPLEEPFFLPNTIDIVGNALVNALIPISKMLIKQEDKDRLAAQAFADVLCETLMGVNKCDKNGKFINDIRATKYDVSVAELNDYDRNEILDSFPIQGYIDKVGGESLYFFSYASLGNMIDVANELYDYVQYVKERTDSEKVNIVPVSQGGSIMNALLAIYNEKGRSAAEDFNRIVYVVPALDGSLIIGEAYEYGFIDDDDELYNKMIPALMGEDDVVSYLINIVLRIMPNADLNGILDAATETLVQDYMKYSTLMWGLCPTDNYIPKDSDTTGRIGARAMYLLDEDSKEILRQTDWYYNEAQMKSDENILKAKADGVEIFDIVDYNFQLFHVVDSYDDVNADGIIQLDSTSMVAYSVNCNTPLPADHEAMYTAQCSDPDNHNHISPDKTVDAGAGLLPDTTFYFNGQPHEQTASNDVIITLVSELIMNNEITDVYSTPRFPQFNGTRKTKSLVKDIAEMKVYDTSDVPLELVIELEDAIIQAERMLNNTIINDEETKAAEKRFYAARSAVLDYDPDSTGSVEEAPEKENTAYFDFMPALSQLIEVLSKILSIFFGGNGFFEMGK